VPACKHGLRASESTRQAHEKHCEQCGGACASMDDLDTSPVGWRGSPRAAPASLDTLAHSVLLASLVAAGLSLLWRLRCRHAHGLALRFAPGALPRWGAASMHARLWHACATLVSMRGLCGPMLSRLLQAGRVREPGGLADMCAAEIRSAGAGVGALRTSPVRSSGRLEQACVSAGTACLRD